MVTAGILFVRNEEDVLFEVLKYSVEQFDFILAIENESTDSTKDILTDYNIDFVVNSSEKYQFSKVMTELAHWAGSKGADWIVPFDADEFWYAPEGTVSSWLSAQTGFACTTMVYDYFVTDQDVDSESFVERMCWRTKDPVPLKDIACRYDSSMVITNGSHMVNYDFQADFFTGLSVKHYPIRSFEQFEAKTIRGKKLFELTPELPSDEGNHWRERIRAYDEGSLVNFYKKHIEIQSPSKNKDLIFDNDISRSPE